MRTKPFIFRIRRFEPGRDEKPRYASYTLDVPQGMTVLEALLRIQAEQDGSLAFRYACRGAVCGSCAMMIDRREALACRTQVHGPTEEEHTIYRDGDRAASKGQIRETQTITVEPLRNLKVIKDLVVDMEPFFEKLQAVQPWLQPQRSDPDDEWLVEPDQLTEAEPYTHCILCAACYSVCPVAEEDPAYLGPAALAQHYRFLADVRDEADERRLASVAGVHGVGGCDFVWNCTEICPKGVPPTKGIAKSRARITRAERRHRV